MANSYKKWLPNQSHGIHLSASKTKRKVMLITNVHRRRWRLSSTKCGSNLTPTKTNFFREMSCQTYLPSMSILRLQLVLLVNLLLLRRWKSGSTLWKVRHRVLMVSVRKTGAKVGKVSFIRSLPRWKSSETNEHTGCSSPLLLGQFYLVRIEKSSKINIPIELVEMISKTNQDKTGDHRN